MIFLRDCFSLDASRVNPGEFKGKNYLSGEIVSLVKTQVSEVRPGAPGFVAGWRFGGAGARKGVEVF
jgi:thioesterase domain-containing protein